MHCIYWGGCVCGGFSNTDNWEIGFAFRSLTDNADQSLGASFAIRRARRTRPQGQFYVVRACGALGARFAPTMFPRIVLSKYLHYIHTLFHHFGVRDMFGSVRQGQIAIRSWRFAFSWCCRLLSPFGSTPHCSVWRSMLGITPKHRPYKSWATPL